MPVADRVCINILSDGRVKRVCVRGKELIMTADMMKAIRIHSYGASCVLKYEDVAVPDIGPDEMLVKVHSTGLNPVDWKIREGLFSGMHKLPLIPGWDFAGTVERCGALVSGFKPNDRVFALPDITRDGSYAEYIAIRADEAAHVPKGMPLEEAAGVSLASLTAWNALFKFARLRAGQTVLIHGASGGVGTFAVQLAKIAGAYVIATTSAANINFIKSLGADDAIDYRSEDFSKKLKNIDVVMDAVGPETHAKSFGVMRRGGILVSLLTEPDEALMRRCDVSGGVIRTTANGSRLMEISRLIEDGRLMVIIDREFPLTEAAAAQDYSKVGHARGKIILRVDMSASGDAPLKSMKTAG